MNVIDELRATVEALEARVVALEASASTEPPATPDASASTNPQGPDPETFWALTGLRERRAAHPVTESGAVMLVGSLTLPDGAPVEWQQAGATDALLESDWSEVAETLGALGHPVRLELLRLILGGTATTAELAEADGLGTTGQLHHHLRQLVSAGWVRQAGRGRYTVPAARVVPLLATVVGAER
ncbi:ArsR/SmtB family transcription factor [Georgenia sp. Z1491]|uniref:ArsR/SmtB family transcription factor n=1 Tax=Georgenia sp. Z1491 TaxID=3416707 RepID=UPI003CF4E676